MTDSDSDLLDDFVFEPNGWDFAVDIGIRADPETERPALDDLADAMLVWAQGPELERLTDEAVERVWNGELAGWIREGIVRLAAREEWKQGAARALGKFDRDPPASDVAREVVRHLAMQLSQDDQPLSLCLLCIEDALGSVAAGARRAHAARVAIVAARNADVPELELREALAGAGRRSPVERLGTRGRREAVRARLGRLGELGAESMPALARELTAIAGESLPERALDDDVWQLVCVHLLEEVGRPHLN